MTPEAQRVAIAEACGWKTKYRDPEAWHPLPDYLNDLNAMYDAEGVLGPKWASYCEKLLEIVEPEPRTLEVCHYWNLLHATSAQRAEAFLRTIGKWKECK